MAKGQPSEKEIREKRTSIAIKTLENKVLQGVLGSNQVRNQPFLYGQLGLQGGEEAYNSSMASKEAQEARTAAYNNAKEKGDALGVFGEPSISNYEVSTQIIEQIEGSKLVLSLGDLEKVVKSVASGFNFSLPEELSEYVPAELMQKEELTEEEKDALTVYQRLLSPAYNRGAALNAAKKGYFSDLNMIGKQVSDKYKKEDSE